MRDKSSISRTSREVDVLRQMITENDPEYSRLTDDELRERAREMIELRARQVSSDEAFDAVAVRFYSSLDYKQRRALVDSVFESIRGLGVLGRIIADKSITEVMINGFDRIFVERNGHL